LVCLDLCSQPLIVCRGAPAQGDIQPVAPSAGAFIHTYRACFLRVANKHGIDVLAIAGVIAAEQTLNRNFKDTVQDTFLEYELATRPAAFWEPWRIRCRDISESATEMFVKTGKWPQELVRNGYVMSFGPAQITPRTLFSAFERTGIRDFPATEEVMAGLLKPHVSIEYAAIILKAEGSDLKSWNSHDSSKYLGQLGTLYSCGSLRILRAKGGRALHLSDIPVNPFGRWMESNRDQLRRLLSEDLVNPIYEWRHREVVDPRQKCLTSGGTFD
jgi:hypothetical protein